jgi:hypothetical protein
LEGEKMENMPPKNTGYFIIQEVAESLAHELNELEDRLCAGLAVISSALTDQMDAYGVDAAVLRGVNRLAADLRDQAQGLAGRVSDIIRRTQPPTPE